MELLKVTTQEHVDVARQLFEEYAASLDYELCFQNFTAELAQLPGEYSPPSGGLLLAVQDREPVGCAALRRLGNAVCEMKRLYVRPGFRGLGIGMALAGEFVSQARRMGYRIMRLETVGSMHHAQRIYESLGFVDTQGCGCNQLEGVRCMALTL